MFSRIILRDLNRPVRGRHWEFVGPLEWVPRTPAEAGRSLEFYGSPPLRHVPTRKILSPRLRARAEWKASEDFSFEAVIARLPSGRGFLAGWKNNHGCGRFIGRIYASIEAAAFAACREAEAACVSHIEWLENEENDDDDDASIR